MLLFPRHPHRTDGRPTKVGLPTVDRLSRSKIGAIGMAKEDKLGQPLRSHDIIIISRGESYFVDAIICFVGAIISRAESVSVSISGFSSSFILLRLK